jgi:hypothetical protein
MKYGDVESSPVLESTMNPDDVVLLSVSECVKDETSDKYARIPRNQRILDTLPTVRICRY